MIPILGLIASAAPTIFKWFSSDKPDVVDVAKNLVKEKLFGDVDFLDSKLEDKLTDPKILVKLKELDKTFDQEMAKIGLEYEKVHAEDRQSARDMQKDTNSYIPGILSSVIMIGFFSLLGILAFYDVPVKNKDMLNILLGSLTTMAMSVVSFYFGSSLGSKNKDKLRKK